jgi:hypothetical protein
MAAIMKMAVFWVVVPRSLVEVYRRFRGACCLHHQGDRPTSVNFYQACQVNLTDTVLCTFRYLNVCVSCDETSNPFCFWFWRLLLA